MAMIRLFLLIFSGCFLRAQTISSSNRTVQNCVQKRNSLLTNGDLNSDTFVPNCALDGSYSPSQCNSATGQCWCVNVVTGEEIAGTKTGAGQDPTFCEGSKKCPNEPPLKDSKGLELFCGTGAKHQDCPTGYECNRHPAGLYAVCCKHEDAPTIPPRVVERPKGGELKSLRGGVGHVPVITPKPQTSDAESSQDVDQPAVGTTTDGQFVGRCSTVNTPDYVPKCTSDGYYDWVQCDNKKKTCWCVNPDTGEELAYTRKNGSVSCLDCYANGPLLSNFRPACELPINLPSQKYTECPSFVTSCGCMDLKTGKDIEKSIVHGGQKMPRCEYLPTLRGPCNVTAMLNATTLVAQCSVMGFFAPNQCDVQNGYSCYCVDPENKKEIKGTRKPPGSDGRLTECPKCLFAKYVGLDYLIFGAFVPQCTETGEFNPLQCNNNTGVCFCVYTDGNIVPGTRKAKSEGIPKCKISERPSRDTGDFSVNPIQSPKTVLSADLPPSSESQGSCISSTEKNIQCTNDGFYDWVQCDGHSNGYCWCVNPDTGVELEGTRKSGNITCLGTVCPKITRPSVIVNFTNNSDCLTYAPFNTTCIKNDCMRHGPLFSRFLKFCNVEPSMMSQHSEMSKTRTCPPFAKTCGCVDVTTGVQLSGHDVSSGQPFPKCQFMPTVKGSCVNSSDDKINAVQCTQNECMFFKALALDYFPILYIPQCNDTTGEFVSSQCDSRTDMCFCVDSNGDLIPGSRQKGSTNAAKCSEMSNVGQSSNPISVDSNTDSVNEENSACLQQLKNAVGNTKAKPGSHPLIGGFIPRCSENGKYEPLQCHGSTGQCWCVTENGTEIAGTRSAPGKPRPVCVQEGNSEQGGNKHETSKCLKEKNAAIEQTKGNSEDGPMTGVFIPSCTETGNYEPVQCHPSTGYCWCVTSNGTEIPDTRVAPGEHRSSCKETSGSNEGAVQNQATGQPFISTPKGSDIHIAERLNVFCTLSLEYGNRSAPDAVKTDRWYYNKTIGSCQQFTYYINEGRDIGNENNFKSKADCDDHCHSGKTSPESSIDVSPSVEQTSDKSDSSGAICDQPKDYGSPCAKNSNSNTELRWYFNEQKRTCMAFKYSGCGGTQNNFKTKRNCEIRCKPQDGPTCSGNSAPYTTNVTDSPTGRHRFPHCAEVECPPGFICRMGWMSASCCNVTTEKIFDDAYDVHCSANRKALTENYDGQLYPTVVFGDSCDDLLCPKGYACNQTNSLFAKCCSTSDFVKDVEPNKEERREICPTGIPLTDSNAGGYRICHEQSPCPNGTFCFNSTHPRERNVLGICCTSSKVPVTLKRVLAQQNCSSQQINNIHECLRPFDGLTKRFDMLSVASAANVADLFPENVTVVSLKETCDKYQNYTQCTKNIFQTGYCYNHKNHMVNEILGFACDPKTIAEFQSNRKCLEDVIQEQSVKECVFQFAQTLRLLKDTVDSSFGGLCSSIERFVACIQPSVVANCSANTFDLIRQFVNRTINVVFGGSCQQVVLDEQEAMVNRGIADGDCTKEQTQALQLCSKKFVSTPEITHNFSPSLETPTLLVNPVQVDMLDPFCTAYKSYEICTEPVTLINPTCKPPLFRSLVSIIGYNCREDVMKKWKRHAPCISKLIEQNDARRCFEILNEIQKGFNGTSGINPPLNELCQKTESHAKCMEKPVTDECGKEAYDFYSDVYANTKKTLFAPCYQFQVEENNEQHVVDQSSNVQSQTTINTSQNSSPLVQNSTASSLGNEQHVVDQSNFQSQITISPSQNSSPLVQNPTTPLLVPPSNGNGSVANVEPAAKKQSCSLRRDAMLWASTVPNGQYVPQCKDNGEYQSVQCDPVKGTCWCVNEATGDELPGTLVHSNENKTASCGPCHKALVAAVGKNPSTSFIPVCQDNGKYQPLQCSIESGDCWCVDSETGTELQGTRVGPGKKLPTCGVREVYACVRLSSKNRCLPDGSKPQEVFRWYRENNKCKMYRYNYCELEAHVPPYPLKDEKDCQRLCTGKLSDFVPVTD